MRDIKFRGKCKITGNWVFGYYYEYSGKHVICNQDHSDNATTDHWGEVISETIGQYTGLKDIDGNEIYEGDIVSWGMHSERSHEYYYRYAVVEIDPDIQFRILYYIHSKTKEKIETDDYTFRFGNFAYSDTETHLKVIRNIHDNPL